MYIVDEKTGCAFNISDDAFNKIFDHRLRLPKPKDVQAYTVDGENRKIPNVSHTESLQHVFSECFFQMVDNMRKELVNAYDKYHDENSKVTDLTCGNMSLRRSVHIGFWKLLVELTPKKPTFTVANLQDMTLEDSQFFNVMILEAHIKERPQNQNQPALYSKAELERNNTRP